MIRLLNIYTREFREFAHEKAHPYIQYDPHIERPHYISPPPYIIASHRWRKGDLEVSYESYRSNPSRKGLGYEKIYGFCDRVKGLGLDIEWLWVDTCCINKSDSEERQEAITSMFDWYREAKFCLAYLDDVESPTEDALSQSEWWTRGWTLQELVAPRTVIFATKQWELLGYKGPKRQWLKERCPDLKNVTNAVFERLQNKIPRKVLMNPDECINVSSAEKWRWLDGRKTSRREDMAYCMIGLFDVSLIKNYGERDRAMERLRKVVKEKDKKDQGTALRKVLAYLMEIGILTVTIPVTSGLAKSQWDKWHDTVLNDETPKVDLTEPPDALDGSHEHAATDDYSNHGRHDDFGVKPVEDEAHGVETPEVRSRKLPRSLEDDTRTENPPGGVDCDTPQQGFGDGDMWPNGLAQPHHDILPSLGKLVLQKDVYSRRESKRQRDLEHANSLEKERVEKERVEKERLEKERSEIQNLEEQKLEKAQQMQKRRMMEKERLEQEQKLKKERLEAEQKFRREKVERQRSDGEIQEADDVEREAKQKWEKRNVSSAEMRKIMYGKLINRRKYEAWNERVKATMSDDEISENERQKHAFLNAVKLRREGHHDDTITMATQLLRSLKVRLPPGHVAILECQYLLVATKYPEQERESVKEIFESLVKHLVDRQDYEEVRRNSFARAGNDTTWVWDQSQGEYYFVDTLLGERVYQSGWILAIELDPQVEMHSKSPMQPSQTSAPYLATSEDSSAATWGSTPEASPWDANLTSPSSNASGIPDERALAAEAAWAMVAQTASAAEAVRTKAEYTRLLGQGHTPESAVNDLATHLRADQPKWSHQDAVLGIREMLRYKVGNRPEVADRDMSQQRRRKVEGSGETEEFLSESSSNDDDVEESTDNEEAGDVAEGEDLDLQSKILAVNAKAAHAVYTSLLKQGHSPEQAISTMAEGLQKLEPTMSWEEAVASTRGRLQHRAELRSKASTVSRGGKRSVEIDVKTKKAGEMGDMRKRGSSEQSRRGQ